MKVPSSDDTNADRVQVVITVVRHRLGTFKITYASRDGFGPLKGTLSTVQSPTRLVWYVREILAQPLEQMILQEIAVKWGDDLATVGVSPAEVFEQPELAKE